MKKLLIISSLLVSANVFAAQEVIMVPTIDPQKSIQELNKNQPPKGQFNNVPGGNVFIFCSGGRPGKHNPYRVIYDRICPAGDSSKVKAAAAPQIIDQNTGRPVEIPMQSANGNWVKSSDLNLQSTDGTWGNKIQLNPVNEPTPIIRDGVIINNSGGNSNDVIRGNINNNKNSINNILR